MTHSLARVLSYRSIFAYVQLICQVTHIISVLLKQCNVYSILIGKYLGTIWMEELWGRETRIISPAWKSKDARTYKVGQIFRFNVFMSTDFFPTHAKIRKTFKREKKYM